MRECEVCGRAPGDTPTIFQHDPWCSDNCRKAWVEIEARRIELIEYEQQQHRLKQYEEQSKRPRWVCTCGHPGLGCYCR